jgi:LysR family transcriptional regulator, transcriptional activator for bauABCD operon
MSTESLLSGARLFARHVDWNLFLVFHEIVRCGSISAAARVLNKQQPSVSAALKRLEDHLQATLCERGSHGIELTSAGRVVYAHCERMLAQVRSVPHEVEQALGMVEGVITLRTISNVVSPELDAALARFHSLHPAVEIRVDVAPWREVLQSLKAGDVELGIACDDAMSAELRYEPLVREYQQIYCSPRHPRFGGSPCRPAELVPERFILTGQDEPNELFTFWLRRDLARGAVVDRAWRRHRFPAHEYCAGRRASRKTLAFALTGAAAQLRRIRHHPRALRAQHSHATIVERDTP